MRFQRGKIFTNNDLSVMFNDITKKINSLTYINFSDSTAGQFLISTRDGIESEMMNQKSDQYFASNDEIVYNKSANQSTSGTKSYFEQFYKQINEMKGES